MNLSKNGCQIINMDLTDYKKIISFYGLKISNVENVHTWEQLVNSYYNYGTALEKRGYLKEVGKRDEISNATYQKILESKSWSKMSGGRDKGETNTKSHYRKGVAGDWKNHFTEKVNDAFFDNFGNVLDILGYK